MLYKFKKFSQLSLEEKKLFLEAYATLGIMRTAILTFSFKRLTRSLDHSVKKEEMRALNDEEMKIAVKVSQAISRAAAYTPWESACLVQSFTAQKMLKKREIPGVFYLGAAKNEESKEKIKAHSWSQCGDIIVTGGDSKEYTVLSVFVWGKE
jgi:hypothetical protein